MLSHPSQLKSLLLGSKLPNSDLLLTSDKPLTTTLQSAFLLSPALQLSSDSHSSVNSAKHKSTGEKHKVGCQGF